jgi:hypothetical protein
LNGSAADPTDNTATINNAIFDEDFDDSNVIGALILKTNTDAGGYGTNVTSTSDIDPIVFDFFSFGFNNDGRVASERIANQIIRIEAEESGDNTSTFEGTLEYVMINQLNIRDVTTYTGLSTIADDPSFIVIEDLTDEDSPRGNYLDLGSDGVSTQIADQEEAPAHSGTVSFDNNSYKTADTVTITVEDLDLNTDSDLVDIYTTVVSPPALASDPVVDQVGEAGLPTNLSFGDLGFLLDIRFNDIQWKDYNNIDPATTCTVGAGIDAGLGATGFTLVETGQATGVLIGDFQIPSQYCAGPDSTTPVTVTGLDIKTNYVDFRDASGEIIKVSDKAGVRASTGSVSLDRTVYPVPFGIPDDFKAETSTATPAGRSIFPIHATGLAADDSSVAGSTTIGNVPGEFIVTGNLELHIRVNDPD